MDTMYTVSRCKKDNTLYGPTHGARDVDETVCGQEIDDDWWIVSNAFDGVVTCKKCLDILNDKEQSCRPFTMSKWAMK